MFQFYWPWFAILLPLPCLVRTWIFSKKNEVDEASPEVHFPALGRLSDAFPSTGRQGKSSNLPFFILLSLSWICLILALMQPEKVDQFTHVKNEGYDLVLAVDISGSMQAVDFSTKVQTVSRLDATKDVVSQFVKNRQGDRVGLVTFGENAYLHVPLTFDTLAVSRMLNETVAGMAGNGTAIGDAIGLSVRTLRDRPEGSRVLVLLTDGEDNSSTIPPLEAAKLAKQYGIRIYTIGIGKNGVVPFPMANGQYAMAQVSIDEDLLKEIASMTGGQYFHATDRKMLETIYSKINELEKSEADEILFLIREPLYDYVLGLAMGFLLILTLYQLLYRSVFGGS